MLCFWDRIRHIFMLSIPRIKTSVSIHSQKTGGVDIESQHCNCNTYYFIQWSAWCINLTVCSILKRCVQTPVSSRPLHRENILSKCNVLPAQHYASPHQILKKSNRLKWGCKMNDKTEQKWDYPLQWRHNGGYGVSNHQPRDCLLTRLFKRRSKKTSKLRVTGLCQGIRRSPVNSPRKWPATRKIFQSDDIIMLNLKF